MENEEQPPVEKEEPKRKRLRRLHPVDIENLYNMFSKGFEERAVTTLKEAGYPATENEIKLLIMIWFDEYLNRGGTMLKMPAVFIKT